MVRSFASSAWVSGRRCSLTAATLPFWISLELVAMPPANSEVSRRAESNVASSSRPASLAAWPSQRDHEPNWVEPTDARKSRVWVLHDGRRERGAAMTAAAISPFPLVRTGDRDHPVEPCSTCSGPGTTRSRSTGSSDRRPRPRCGLSAEQASVRRRHRRPPHLVGADRHGQAGQPGRRGTRGSGGVPVPQPLRRPEQGPADRRHLRTRDRSRSPRVPASPPPTSRRLPWTGSSAP